MRPISASEMRRCRCRHRPRAHREDRARRAPTAAGCRQSREFRAQLVRGLEHRFAPNRGRARGIGAAAVGRRIGIARDHPHLLHRHAEHAGGDLAHDRVDALPLLGHAHGADDAAAGLELDRAGILRGDRRAAGAVISARPGRRSLDEGRDPDAAMDSLLAQLRLLLAQRRIIHALDQLVEAALMRHVRDLDPGRRDAGIGIVGHDVAPPDLDADRARWLPPPNPPALRRPSCRSDGRPRDIAKSAPC